MPIPVVHRKVLDGGFTVLNMKTAKRLHRPNVQDRVFVRTEHCTKRRCGAELDSAQATVDAFYSAVWWRRDGLRSDGVDLFLAVRRVVVPWPRVVPARDCEELVEGEIPAITNGWSDNVEYRCFSTLERPPRLVPAVPLRHKSARQCRHAHQRIADPAVMGLPSGPTNRCRCSPRSLRPRSRGVR